MSNDDTPRRLSRQETHDLSMIIKDRTKVLKAHVEAQKAAHMADFEKKMAAIYSFDADETWKKAAADAMAAVAAAQEIVDKRSAELGIPKEFAPRIQATWHGRGENALRERRTELRQVAKRAIEAMGAAAIVKIERQGLDLRTQVVAMGIVSPDAKLFLESLAPVEEAMRSLDFKEVEAQLEAKQTSRQIRYGGYGDESIA